MNAIIDIQQKFRLVESIVLNKFDKMIEKYKDIYVIDTETNMLEHLALAPSFVILIKSKNSRSSMSIFYRYAGSPTITNIPDICIVVDTRLVDKIPLINVFKFDENTFDKLIDNLIKQLN